MSGSSRRLPGIRWLPVGLVLLVLLTGNGFALSPPTSTPASPTAPLPGPGELRSVAPASSPPVNVTLSVGNLVANLSNQFFGTTVNNEVRMFRGEATAVNATPARVLVWPGAMAGEDYDPFTQTHYDTYSGVAKHALTNEDQFVKLCEATRCTAIVQVPAEIDNASFAEAVVNYTGVNLSFHPAYWMIGNEPELWSHWKIPWKNWGTQSSGGPDPVQFAHEVLAYVKAIRAVDNTTPILGLPASGCTCGSWTFPQWISGVLNVTGSKVQAVAFHEYPAGWLGTGDGSLEDFYGTIQSAAGIPPRLVAARAAVQSSCHGCNVSVFISEIGAALSWSAYGQYSIGFSGPLSLASQITQGMDANLTNVDLFATELTTTNSWFNNTGHARVDYTLYTGILNHLGTAVYPVNITGLGSTIYGVDTIAPSDQGRRDLLVVNDNITHSIAFAPRFAGTPANAPVELWSWNGSIHTTVANGTQWVEPFTPQPVPHEFPDGLPGNYTLPPQSLVLFETYPAGATYVRVLENGVPAPTAWYASVGPQFYGTTANNLSLLLPAGSYPVASVPLPLPIGGRELTPIEQLAPNAPSPFHVSGSHANVTVTFLTQWAVNASASPAIGGTVSPDVGWWNQNESLNLTATPALGYAFVGWSGFGPGSYSGGGRTATVFPAGRVSEKARFVVGNQVVFEETGLTAGTPWSVSVRGFTSTSTTNLLTVYEPNGHFGFSLSSVAGYRTIPRNGSFTVAGGWSLVHVRYDPITPPQPKYAVTFQVTGLPASMAVAITVRNVTQTTGYFVPQYQLLNGSYVYHVGYEPGYHVAVHDKTFVVRGGAMVVTIPFTPTLYTATWQATGTHPGMNWSVLVDGQTIVAASAWVSTPLPNGTYPYAIELPANYTASPPTGVVAIGGSGVQQPLAFSLAEFRTWFEASGLGSSGAWSVRLGNATQGTSGDRAAFLAANGTYTFDVHAPSGFYAVPSHGTLTVAGAGPPTQIRFYPVSQQPSAALVAALSSGALMTSIWIGGSIFVGFAAVRGLRRRDG